MKTEGGRICCIHVIGEQLSAQADSEVFAHSNSSEGMRMAEASCSMCFTELITDNISEQHHSASNRGMCLTGDDQ